MGLADKGTKNLASVFVATPRDKGAFDEIMSRPLVDPLALMAADSLDPNNVFSQYGDAYKDAIRNGDFKAQSRIAEEMGLLIRCYDYCSPDKFSLD